jgi:hypothetical protein
MRLTLRTLIALLSLTVGQMPSLAAQWPAEIAPGTRVQVRLPETQYQFGGSRGHLLRGRVTALSPDTLYLAVTDSIGPLAIPRLLIDKLAFSRGVPSRTHSALKRGFLSGASSALLLAGLAALNDNPGTWEAGEAALVGGGVGFAMGAIFGALHPRERWKSVDIVTRSSNTGMGLGFGLSTTF